MEGNFKPTTNALVKKIQEYAEDYEFYPSTEEMIDCVKADIDRQVQDHELLENYTMLDCGAGDGRILQSLCKGTKYAIEKSRPLIAAMDRSIFIIGADFDEQSLLDKSVDITFANPPYSQYVDWAEKIITETRSGLVYLIIPKRWSCEARITQALKLRDATATVIGNFDFSHAERKARAVVEIVKVDLSKFRNNRFRSCMSHTDPFTLWFDKHFNISAPATSAFDIHNPCPIKPSTEELKGELVPGSDTVAVLVKLYNRQMDNLISNYKALESLDGNLMRELGIEYKNVRAGLRLKITSCKQGYWQELFDRLTRITDRLTKDTREAMLSKLMSRTDVDFNASNVYAVIIFAIKNANCYLDDQLITTVERMVGHANIKNYVSNQRTFGEENWRYRSRPHELSHYGLEYRIVLNRVGGICVSTSSWDQERYNGLSSSAYHFILDLLTIAGNIGFDTKGHERPIDFSWSSNQKVCFHYTDHATGQVNELFTVRAFLNGNLHFHLNQNFILKLNVEFGRLKGWLKSAQDAATELDISLEEAEASFNNNLKLTSSNITLIEHKQAA